MFICDCHCDTLTKIYSNQEELYINRRHFDVQRLLANGGGLQFMAIYLPQTLPYTGGAKYVLQVLDYFYQQQEQLQQSSCEVLTIECSRDLEKRMGDKVSILLCIEDGGALEGSLEVLRMFYRLGIRCITLTWNHRNQIADGAHECTTGGLTLFGKAVVREMNRLGMVVDVSHISEPGFWDVVATTSKPIMATHSNAKALCPSVRNLTDEQIRAIAKLHGIIGINFYSDFLADTRKNIEIEHIYRQIDYILTLVGEDCLAFGSDFDGISSMPQGISGVESMPMVLEYLAAKYSTATLEKIAYQNLYRILAEII